MAGLRRHLSHFWSEIPTFRKVVRVVLIVLVLLVAAFFAARTGIKAHYGRLLAVEMAEYERLGGSRTLADRKTAPAPQEPPGQAHPFKALYQVYVEPVKPGSREMSADTGQSPEQRLAKALSDFREWKGFDLSGAPPNPRARSGLVRLPWDDEWLPYLRKYLDDNGQALALAREGAKGDPADFNAGQDSFGPAWVVRHGLLEPAFDLLKVEAVLKAHEGDMEAAAEDVRLMFRLPHFIDEDSSLAAKNAAFLQRRRAVGLLQGILQFGSLPRESVEALLREIEAAEEANRLTDALLVETARGLAIFDMVVKDPRHLDEIRPISRKMFERASVRLAFRLVWIPQADRYYHLKYMNAVLRASKADPPGLGAPARPRILVTGALMPLRAVTSSITPDYGYFFRMEASTAAMLKVARAALAVSLYKSENGSYPATLEKLVPEYLREIETDPDTLAPFVYYTPFREGFMVYGSDRTGITITGPDSDAAMEELLEVPVP